MSTYSMRTYIREFFETDLEKIKTTNGYTNNCANIVFHNNLKSGDEKKFPFIRYWFDKETRVRKSLTIYRCTLPMQVLCVSTGKVNTSNTNSIAILAESLLLDLNSYFQNASHITSGKGCSLATLNATTKTIGTIEDYTITELDSYEENNQAYAGIKIEITYTEYLKT